MSLTCGASDMHNNRIVQAFADGFRFLFLAARGISYRPNGIHRGHRMHRECSLAAPFSIPKARQIDVVDRIGKRFWYVEDYQDSSIYSPQPARRRR